MGIPSSIKLYYFCQSICGLIYAGLLATYLDAMDDRTDKILRMRDVTALVGLGRSTIFRMIAAGRFPKAIRLGERARGYKLSELKEWIDERSSAR